MTAADKPERRQPLSAVFSAAHARLLELTADFARYTDSRYLQPGYSQAEARKGFIDPLFKEIARMEGRPA